MRTVGGQKVVLVLVPKKTPQDQQTFYILENKVWNDLYAAFMADPIAKKLFEKWGKGQGREALVSQAMAGNVPEWCKGGMSYHLNSDPEVPPFLGVVGTVKGKEKGSFPVFRVKVTEAHCFAEWLSPDYGKLPTRKQWLQATGKSQDNRPGPFDPVKDQKDLGVGLEDGPLPVAWDKRPCQHFRLPADGREWL